MANNQETKPRVAIVTGGARGIGRSCVERLAGDGFSIVVNYASNDTEANAAVASIVDQGGKAIAVRADVADERAIEALFDLTEHTFGGVDVIVHAAGRPPPAPWRVDPQLLVLGERKPPTQDVVTFETPWPSMLCIT